LAWLGEGYRTEEVDMPGEKLVFVRASGLEHAPGLAQRATQHGAQQGMAESMAMYTPQDMGAQHPMIGALKGLLWIDPALDLTKPALDPDEWEQMVSEKYGKDQRGT
jgi:hypothetical protein